MPLQLSRSLIKIRWESITNWCEGVDISDAKLLLLFIMLFCKSSDELPAAGNLAPTAILGAGNAILGIDEDALSRGGGVLELLGEPTE